MHIRQQESDLNKMESNRIIAGFSAMFLIFTVMLALDSNNDNMTTGVVAYIALLIIVFSGGTVIPLLRNRALRRSNRR